MFVGMRIAEAEMRLITSHFCMPYKNQLEERTKLEFYLKLDGLDVFCLNVNCLLHSEWSADFTLKFKNGATTKENFNSLSMVERYNKSNDPTCILIIERSKN